MRGIELQQLQETKELRTNFDQPGGQNLKLVDAENQSMIEYNAQIAEDQMQPFENDLKKANDPFSPYHQSQPKKQLGNTENMPLLREDMAEEEKEYNQYGFDDE